MNFTISILVLVEKIFPPKKKKPPCSNSRLLARLSSVMRCCCRRRRLVLRLVILFVPLVFGFALDPHLDSDSDLDSLLIEPEPEPEPEPGLLPLDDRTAPSLHLDRFAGVTLPEGEEEEEEQEEDAAIGDTTGSIIPSGGESIVSHPLPSESFDDSLGTTGLFFDAAADCSTSESLLPLPAIGGKLRVRQRGDDHSQSCSIPSPSPPNTSPMTANLLPPQYDDDDEDDPLLPLAGGLGAAILGISFYSDCADATTYALPMIYCNTGTKKDVQYTGKHDFQFRGKFDTWTLYRYFKGKFTFSFCVLNRTPFSTHNFFFYFVFFLPSFSCLQLR